MESESFDERTPSVKANASLWLRPELVAPWREIIAVLALTLGYYIYSAAWLAVHRWDGHKLNLRPSNYSDLHLIAEMSAILAVLLLYLKWRGWTPADLKISPNWRSTLQALLLLTANLAVLIAGIFAIRSWNLAHPSLLAPKPYSHANIGHLNWTTMLTHQMINALLEEVLCMSYAFNQFAAKRGPLVAFILILLLRVSYHAWKSPGYLSITVIAFSIYGLWYWRTRNVWPLILAHVCFDVILSIPQVR